MIASFRVSPSKASMWSRHPVLVNRPIVATPKGVTLGRPSEMVLDLLNRSPPGPLFKEDGQLIIDGEGTHVSV